MPMKNEIIMAIILLVVFTGIGAAIKRSMKKKAPLTNKKTTHTVKSNKMRFAGKGIKSIEPSPYE